jgi:peptidyl-prolyl cis-trans isomerase D
MIGSFRNFAKTKFAGLLVFIMIIPFVFWGMGGMFSSGNTNNIAKINKTNISTQDFIDYLNKSGIPQETIKKNLDDNIIQEILSGLVSITLLELEIKDFDIIISENTLLNKIKKNKNFLDENGNFQRIKYEKFLLENNQSAPAFELRLRGRELQKNLFDYVGAGTVSPQFLINRLFEEENKKLEIEFINLENFYKNKDNITNQDLEKFIKDNQDQLKIEYVDFNYAIINPKNLIGADEFNQSFFDKIDQIEIDISNDVSFENIISDLDIKSINVKNFKFSQKKNEIEKKIFELRNNKFDIFENKNDYILYEISNIEEKKPDLNDKETKEEVLNLVFQKNKFDYNRTLLEKINNNEFSNDDFLNMGKDKIEITKLNSIRDNKKFEINAVEILYSLPVNSFTLINDEKNNIYLAKIKKFENKIVENDNDKLNEYVEKQKTNQKNSLLKSYDLLLNEKYNVTLNQKTIERVKNYFK